MARQQDSSMTPQEFRDAWRTPAFVFKYLHSIFNFDVDLAADEKNAKLPVFLDSHATQIDWSLLGAVGWCNPPFSQQAEFIAWAISQAEKGFVTAMLLPCFNGQGYWGQIYENAFVTQCIGRLPFESPCDFERIIKTRGKPDRIELVKEGDPLPGNTLGSCFVQFGGVRRLPEIIYRDDMK